MVKFDDILEEIRTLNKVEVSTSEKEVEKKTNETYSGDLLLLIFGVLFALCWITALYNMIGDLFN